MPVTTRVSIAPENLPYLESLAQTWGLDNLSKTLNYLLFDLKRQGLVTAATTPYIQIPSSEMYSESLPASPATAPIPGKFTPFEEIESQSHPQEDEVVKKFALLIEEF